MPKGNHETTEFELMWNGETTIPQSLDKRPYWYESKPRSYLVPTKATKIGSLAKNCKPAHAPPPPPEPYKNVMYESRVVRGSNFGQPHLCDMEPCERVTVQAKKKDFRKKIEVPSYKRMRVIIGDPPPLRGRLHEVIQTDRYIEEIMDRVPTFTVDTQTDLFVEPEPPAPYVPAKTGVDVATEIGDGELDNFDTEAIPIIDLLVNKAIDESVTAVQHETAVEVLRKKQNEIVSRRQKELADIRQLEEEELHDRTERVQRLKQDVIAMRCDLEMHKKATMASVLQDHISGMLPEILDNLEPATNSYGSKILHESIGAWLSAEVAQEISHIVDSREILTVIIKEIIKQRAATYAGYKEPLEPQLDMGALEEGEALTEMCCPSSKEEEACSSPISSEKTVNADC